MIEWFDMGKYDFYVWTSIGVFLVALLIDYFSLRNSNKQLKRMIIAKTKKTTNRQQQANNRSELP